MIAHIGLPKTGTTFLQNHVFPKMQLDYANYQTCVSLFKGLQFDDDTVYERPVLKHDLFSLESLAGSLFRLTNINRTRNAKRLKDCGIEKIIIVTRNERDLIKSLYKQYLNEGGCLSFIAWREWFNFDYLEIDRLAELYHDLFGRKNVLILGHEKLVRNPDEFTKTICRFCEVPFVRTEKVIVHKSISMKRARLLRFANHFTRSNLRPSDMLPKWLTTNKFRGILD